MRCITMQSHGNNSAIEHETSQQQIVDAVIDIAAVSLSKVYYVLQLASSLPSEQSKSPSQTLHCEMQLRLVSHWN